MNLPFTTEQFLQVFENYNLSVWPVQLLLFLLGIIAVSLVIWKRRSSDRLVCVILAFLWLWTGVAYHLARFSSINGAAYGFGVLCILQAALFLYVGVFKPSLSFQYRPDKYGISGAVLIAYAMLFYPLLGYFFGHVYPKSPTFGLPCPTTIFTLGILLWTEKRTPYLILAIPILWSVIGSSASFALGMREDVGLLVAALVTVVSRRPSNLQYIQKQ